MANPKPLQRGDVAPDLSDYNFSNEADRRADQTVTIVRSNPQNYHGEYPAADQSRAEGGRLWKVGQATPNEFLSAPFPVIQMDGDATGYPAEVHEIDLDSYGDCYDPTAPMRVRTVTNYHLDSDHDGQLN
jgi:hypothetical protein